MRTNVWRERSEREERRPGERGGFVVLVLLVLLAVLATLAVANAGALNHLKGRLLLIEKKQQARWQEVAVQRARIPEGGRR